MAFPHYESYSALRQKRAAQSVGIILAMIQSPRRRMVDSRFTMRGQKLLTALAEVNGDSFIPAIFLLAQVSATRSSSLKPGRDRFLVWFFNRHPRGYEAHVRY